MRVFPFVLIGHALFLVVLLFLTPGTVRVKPPPKIVVTTFAANLEKIEAKSMVDEIDEEEIALVEEEAAPPPAPPAPEPEPEPVAEQEVEEEPPAPPPKPKPAAEKKPTAEKKPAPKKSPTPPPPKPKPKPQAKVAPKKTPEKKPPKPVVKAPVPKKAAPKQTKPSNDKLVSLMKESLAKLEGSKTGGKTAKGTSAPQKVIGSLQSEKIKDTGAGKLSYEAELAIYLKHRMQLPDDGDVRMQLTLSDLGKVIQVAIVSSSSQKNRSHVEEKVPSIKFPPFDERLAGEKKHTFQITLKSD